MKPTSVSEGLAALSDEGEGFMDSTLIPQTEWLIRRQAAVYEMNDGDLLHATCESHARSESDMNAQEIEYDVMLYNEVMRRLLIIDKLLAHSWDNECGSECVRCAVICCPHGEPLHFHHDGCPACCTWLDYALYHHNKATMSPVQEGNQASIESPDSGNPESRPANPPSRQAALKL